MELGPIEEVKTIVAQIEARLIPPPNRQQFLVIARHMIWMAEQLDDLRAKLYHAEQTIDAGRRIVAATHDALLGGASDKELLEMMTPAYGFGQTHNVRAELPQGAERK